MPFRGGDPVQSRPGHFYYIVSFEKQEIVIIFSEIHEECFKLQEDNASFE